MKNFIKILLIYFFLFSVSYSAEKIAFVDIDFIINSSEIGKKLTILSYLSGFITPIVVVYIIYHVRKYGWGQGLSEVWYKIDGVGKRRSSIPVDETDEITDDML